MHVPAALYCVSQTYQVLVFVFARVLLGWAELVHRFANTRGRGIRAYQVRYGFWPGAYSLFAIAISRGLVSRLGVAGHKSL